MSNHEQFIKIEFPEPHITRYGKAPYRQLQLYIKDFPHHGMSFKTQIISWDFEHEMHHSSWPGSQIRKPFVITRRRDEHSHVFATMQFQYRRVGDGVTKLKLPEVTLIGDSFSGKNVLLNRYIFYFTDCDVIKYITRSNEETINFNFAKGWIFDSPGVMRTGP